MHLYYKEDEPKNLTFQASKERKRQDKEPVVYKMMNLSFFKKLNHQLKKMNPKSELEYKKIESDVQRR